MIFALLFLFYTLANCNETKQIEDKLIFTQVIFRHGERTIRHTFPNDKYKDPIHWPDGMGQLTKLGKQQAYALGGFFHLRYGQFLGTFSPEKIAIVSSDYDRTINSVSLVLAAMFPPKGNQIWDTNLLWQPIAVHSIPKEMDYLISAEEACTRYIKLREEYEESPEMRAVKDPHQNLFEYLEKHTGKQIRTIVELRDIYDNLDVEYHSNKTLPDWAASIFPGDDLEYLAFYWPIYATGTTELKRLKSGFLFKEILDRFKNKTLSLLPDRLMQIYSGHDITMSCLLNSLGIFEIHLPPYSSSLLFELYETSNGHYMQLFYKNSANISQPLEIPGCGTKCTLNELYELYQDILPSEFKTECQLSSDSRAIYLSNNRNHYITITFSTLYVFLNTSKYFWKK